VSPLDSTLRQKALELALHECFQAIAPSNTEEVLKRAEAFLGFLRGPPVDSPRLPPAQPYRYNNAAEGL
jgi:hypothetical protein